VDCHLEALNDETVDMKYLNCVGCEGSLYCVNDDDVNDCGYDCGSGVGKMILCRHLE
jgi:hypothetical protein